MGHLRGTSCYLVGPIEHDPNSGCDWRIVVSEWMKERGIRVYNPLDRPKWMQCIKKYIPPDATRDAVLLNVNGREDEPNNPWVESQAMVRKICQRFVATCDFVFCYLTNTKTYGTVEELVIAEKLGKPIITVLPDGSPSLWLFDMLLKQPKFKRTYDALEHLGKIDSGQVRIDALDWIFIGDDYEFKVAKFGGHETR